MLQQPGISRAANDAVFRNQNMSVTAPLRGDMSENFDMFKMVPRSGFALDESAANRHQDRYFHLEDETMVSMTVMGLTMNSKSEWLLQEPDGIPIQAVSSLRYARRLYVFDQTRWEVTPEEGPTRTMQSFSRSEEGTLIRKGKQIEISGEGTTTAAGRAFLEMQKEQAAITLRIEMQFCTAQSLLLSRQCQLDDMAQNGDFNRSFKNLIEMKFSEFALFQKDDNAPKTLITRYVAALANRQGNVAARFLAVPGGLEYFFRGVGTQLEYEKNGPSALEKIQQNPLSVTSISGLRIRTTQKVLNPDYGPIKIDPLTMDTSVGMLYRMFPLPKTKYQGADAIKYDKSHRTIKVMDLNADDKFSIRLETALDACVSFGTNMTDIADHNPYNISGGPMYEVDLFRTINQDGTKTKFVHTIGSVGKEFLSMSQLELVVDDLDENFEKVKIVGGLLTPSFATGALGTTGGNSEIRNLLERTITAYDGVTGLAAKRSALGTALTEATTKTAFNADFHDPPGGTGTAAYATRIKPEAANHIGESLRMPGGVTFGTFIEPNAASVAAAVVMSTDEMHASNLEKLPQEHLNAYESAMNLDALDRNVLAKNTFTALQSDDPSLFQERIAAPLNVLVTVPGDNTKQQKQLAGALALLQKPLSSSLMETDKIGSELGFTHSPVGFYSVADVSRSPLKFQGLSTEGELLDNPVAVDLNTSENMLSDAMHLLAGHSVNTRDLHDRVGVKLKETVYQQKDGTVIPIQHLPLDTNGSDETRVLNFERRLHELWRKYKSEAHKFFYGLLVCLVPLEREALKKLAIGNIHVPFAFGIVFPHVRIQTATMIIGAGGRQAGINAVYNPNAWKHADGAHKMRFINFTVSHSTIILSPERFIIVDNVAITNYYNGHSCTPYKPENFEEFKNNHYEWDDSMDDTPSWYSMILPVTKRLPDIVDAKGYYSHNKPQDAKDWHFITDFAALDQLYSDIGPNQNPFNMPDYDGSIMRHPKPNTVLIQGTQWCYNEKSKDYTAVLRGTKSAFGKNMYPGMMPVIRCLEITFADQTNRQLVEFEYEVDE
jgi:hypothetical protein